MHVVGPTPFPLSQNNAMPALGAFNANNTHHHTCWKQYTCRWNAKIKWMVNNANGYVMSRVYAHLGNNTTMPVLSQKKPPRPNTQQKVVNTTVTPRHCLPTPPRSCREAFVGANALTERRTGVGIHVRPSAAKPSLLCRAGKNMLRCTPMNGEWIRKWHA